MVTAPVQTQPTEPATAQSKRPYRRTLPQSPPPVPCNDLRRGRKGSAALNAKNLASRCKLADKTRREADLAISKITRADDCQRISSRFLEALERIPDTELDRIGLKSPAALAIPAGILLQNLERLTSKPQSAVTINLDLSGIANAASALRESRRQQAELLARCERLENGATKGVRVLEAESVEIPSNPPVSS